MRTGLGQEPVRHNALCAESEGREMNLCQQERNQGQQGVVVLHGLARTKYSMYFLGAYLRRQGFLVINAGYPSRKQEIEQLAKSCIPPAIDALRRQGATQIHFVTHSMGGILVRAFLRTERLPELGRVVMLSPPNQGSELVDHLSRYRWFRSFFGPAGCQLGTSSSSVPLQLGEISFPTGIITGNRSFRVLSGRFFPGLSDGKVSVERAQIPGMSDFFIVPCGHSCIMNHRNVWEQVMSFLESGRFRR